jgi:DNA-binding SARP family transcriptional activator
MPTLHLFGTPTLESDDGKPIGGAASQRHRIALLALLARGSGACTRDKLVALLWPESSGERARSSLNESLYVLRRALGDEVIVSSGDDVRLGDALMVDVARFEESIVRGDHAAAVATYRGAFLDGFFLTRAGEFERWAEVERERLAGKFRTALEALASELDRHGDASGAVALWRRLVAEAPLDARLTTRLMESLVAAGNRAAALEHARVHTALTAAEEALPADPQVAALADRIRDGWTPQAPHERARSDSQDQRSAAVAPIVNGILSRRPAGIAALAIVILGTTAMFVRHQRVSAAAAAGSLPAASALYAVGHAHLVHHREADIREAIAAFDSAVSLDRRFARAHAGLAIAAAEMHLRFAPVDEAPAWGQRALKEAQLALALDSTLAEAHEALAAVHRKSEFDWEGTIAESRRAIQLDPSGPQPWFYMAGALYHLGLLPEADRAVHMGLDAQPSADRTEALRTLGTVAIAAGRYSEAAALLQEVQRLSDRPVSDTHLAAAYFYSGERDRAERLLQPLLSSRSASAATRAQASLASFAASRGDQVRARDLLARAERGMVDHHVAYSIGVAYAQLGDAASAVRWLRTAWETGFRCYPWYTRDPLLTPLRKDIDYRNLEEEFRRQWERDRVRFGQ